MTGVPADTRHCDGATLITHQDELAMVRSPVERAVDRAALFEVCEPRTVLAAHALAASDLSLVPETASDLELVGGQLQADWGLTGAGQTVAVIDSGIAYDHYALGGGFGTSYRVVGGWDFTEENDADPYDDAPAGFHGTHVAGIIGSQDVRHPGIAPDVDFVALRVFNDQGRSDFRWIERALRWVHEHQFSFEHPITTVNLSIGAMTSSASTEWRTLDDELEQLSDAGIFISVAAGNNYEKLGKTGLSYPASSSRVVPVGSIGPDGLSQFSQRVPRMLVAPGESITSTATDFIDDFNGITDDFYAASGTSMASPYVAGAAIVVRQAFELVGRTQIDQSLIHRTLYSTADVIHDDASGHDYRSVNLSAALRSIVRTTNTLEAHTAISLDDASYAELKKQQVSAGLWYRLTAAQSGLLSIDVQPAKASAPVLVKVLDGQTQPLAQQRGNGEQRLDLSVSANETYFVFIASPTSRADLTFANLVNVRGSVATIRASNGVHQIVVDRANTATINQLTYRWSSDIDHVRVQADSFTTTRIVGGIDPDLVTIRGNSAVVFGSSYRVDVAKSRQIYIDGGEGQGDVVRMYGSAEDEVFVGGAMQSRMAGRGYFDLVSGFEAVYAFSGGGLDRAFLHGTDGDDIFVTTDIYARLSSGSQLNYVESFERVYAYADPLGLDRAYLHGSAQGDQLVAHPSHVQMSSGNQIRYAAHFDRVYAYAQAGADRATLFDSPGADRLNARPEEVSLQGDGYLQYLFGFESVVAQSLAGGYDRAVVSGYRPGDELFVGTDWATISSPTSRRRIVAFDQVHAIGNERIDLMQVAAALASFRAQTGYGFRSDRQIVWSDEWDGLSEGVREQPNVQHVTQAIDELLDEDT